MTKPIRTTEAPKMRRRDCTDSTRTRAARRKAIDRRAERARKGR